jgi:integrase
MKKNPNGYGTVYKLSSKNRTRPYVAKRTAGWKKKGDGHVQQYEVIGYYPTRIEAVNALSEFWTGGVKQAPALTFKDVYNEWSAVHFDRITRSMINQYRMAFNHLKSLHHVRFVDLRTSHYQQVINNSTLKHGSLEKLKILVSMLYDYAIPNDICSKNYGKYIALPKNDRESRQAFTDTDIKKLWNNTDIPYADSVLIMIYTGLRIGELLSLTRFNIDLDKQTITGGLKTDAGKNRVVPIHPKIMPFIRTRYADKLFPVSYSTYIKKFKFLMDELGIQNKTPHSARHTFASLMARKGADIKALQDIIGHANYSTTADIYTHLTLDDLRKAIELL